jgi:Mn-dependent DtxR family transcriptional regulator
MPITIDKFENNTELTTPSIAEQVITHLAGYSNKAFTRSEIAAAINADPNAVGSALSRLKDRGLVRHRDTYWAITDDTDRLRSAYDLHTLFDQMAADETENFDADAWLQNATPADEITSEE